MYVISQFKTKAIFRELHEHAEKYAHSFSEQQKKRIRIYIGIILYEMTLIAQLRGRKLNQQEELRACYLGILIPLVDDINDEHKINSLEIHRRFTSKEENGLPQIAVARYFYEQLLKTLSSKEDFLHIQELATAAQDASMRQLESAFLSQDEIQKITYSKGGYAAQLYAALLEEPMQDGEKEAHHTLGYSIQLINDMFDVWKDLQNKQQTLFTNSADWKIEEQAYQSSIQEVFSRFRELGYSADRTEQFLIRISILCGRGSVCMEQLLALQTEKGTPIQIHNYARKELICDMEKVRNLWASYRFSMEHYKQYSRSKN